MSSFNHSTMLDADELYDTGRFTEMLDLVRKAWGNLSLRRDADCAEVCRKAYLACMRQGLQGEAHLWKSRAWSGFILCDHRPGLATLVMTEAFAANHQRNPEAALAALEEMRTLMSLETRETPGRPAAETVAGLYQEKRAFFLAKLHRHAEAAEAYDLALLHTKDDRNSRRSLKISGGKALCLFHLGQTAQAIEETARICAESEPYKDVAEAAAHNLGVMQKGGPPPPFMNYEIE